MDPSSGNVAITKRPRRRAAPLPKVMNWYRFILPVADRLPALHVQDQRGTAARSKTRLSLHCSAKALGHAVPPSPLARADEMIDSMAYQGPPLLRVDLPRRSRLDEPAGTGER